MAGDIESVERVAGIEPARSAWEADRLPLHHTRDANRRRRSRFKPGLPSPSSRRSGGHACVASALHCSSGRHARDSTIEVRPESCADWRRIIDRRRHVAPARIGNPDKIRRFGWSACRRRFATRRRDTSARDSRDSYACVGIAVSVGRKFSPSRRRHRVSAVVVAPVRRPVPAVGHRRDSGDRPSDSTPGRPPGYRHPFGNPRSSGVILLPDPGTGSMAAGPGRVRGRRPCPWHESHRPCEKATNLRKNPRDL